MLSSAQKSSACAKLSSAQESESMRQTPIDAQFGIVILKKRKARTDVKVDLRILGKHQAFLDAQFGPGILNMNYRFFDR